MEETTNPSTTSPKAEVVEQPRIKSPVLSLAIIATAATIMASTLSILSSYVFPTKSDLFAIEKDTVKIEANLQAQISRLESTTRKLETATSEVTRAVDGLTDKMGRMYSRQRRTDDNLAKLLQRLHVPPDPVPEILRVEEAEGDDP